MIAVNPDEVAPLTEAMAVEARLTTIPRSGRPVRRWMPTSVNIFRKHGTWRYATYIDGELSRLGNLRVEDGATESGAIEAARRMCMPYLGGVTIERVADMPRARKPAKRRGKERPGKDRKTRKKKSG